MQSTTLQIIINRSVEEVFKFIINPQNTPLWVDFIDEEIVDHFPPQLGTVYRSRRGSVWNESTVTKFKEPTLFRLENDSFLVEYLCEKSSEGVTTVTYLESVKKGELKNSLTMQAFEKLKSLIESV